MLLCDRRAVLLGLFSLAGCGFEPVAEESAKDINLRGKILVDPPTDRDSFELTQRLETRLGRATAPVYGMTVALEVKEEGLAISGSNDITRYNVLGVAAYTVRRLSDGEILAQRRIETFTAYSASQQPVATLAAERDARSRLMVSLADKITSRLIIDAKRFAR